MAFSRSQRRLVFSAGGSGGNRDRLDRDRAISRRAFQLIAPGELARSKTSDGVPIKLGPCGDEQDEAGTAVPTGTVTAYQEGSQVTVTINEVIFHPGFYRIALATTDRSQLPPTSRRSTQPSRRLDPCGSTTFEDPPVFPVLADDVFEHDDRLSRRRKRRRSRYPRASRAIIVLCK